MDPFEAELAALKAEYAASLPGKVDQLAELVESVATGNPAALAELRTRAHRLRGTAGSYGFDAIGRAAGLLEEAVKAVVAGTEPLDPQALRDLLDAVRRAT